VFYWRRRLPRPLAGEVALSLRTRHFREAEHRAALLDAAFPEALRRVATMKDCPEGRVRQVVRDYLRAELRKEEGAEPYIRFALPLPAGPADRPDDALGHWSDVFGPAGRPDHPVAALIHTTLDRIGARLREPDTALAQDDAASVADTVDRLMRAHGLPEACRSLLAIGVWEVNESLKGLRRYLGSKPAPDGAADGLAALASALSPPSRPAPPPEAPPFSALLDDFLARRERTGLRVHTIGQDRPVLRFFAECAGDKPVTAYSRGDVSSYLDRARLLPASYGRSPADRNRPMADLIARAERTGEPRLSEKTAKRHLSTLSAFFKFCRDRGHLTKAQCDDLVSGHRFGAMRAARQQRDAWASEDLKALFASPVWTGCDPVVRSRPGPAIIRDAKFWLPLLALFHGARLEEFADLYRRDIGHDGKIAFVHISAETRHLKTKSAARTIPLHPEIIRLGFLDYIERVAPNPDDPLFPDIEPQGPDRKRGPRITRWFVNYRKQVRLYRRGVGMHAFRHTANTRLRDVIRDFQQERHVRYLLGHSLGAGEGGQRYDKGPGLAAVAKTLALLRYPELDLSHLYAEPAAGGDQPAKAKRPTRRRASADLPAAPPEPPQGASAPPGAAPSRPSRRGSGAPPRPA
jgi:integrase